MLTPRKPITDKGLETTGLKLKEQLLQQKTCILAFYASPLWLDMTNSKFQIWAVNFSCRILQVMKISRLLLNLTAQGLA